jgi:prefoldin beta subunit
MSAEMKIPPHVQNQIAQLQQLQLHLQAVARQKAQVDAVLRDTENALKELEKISMGERETAVIYKSVGEVMIKSKTEVVKEELAQKKETYDLRLKTLERQEERVQKRFQQLQQQLRETLSSGAPGTMPTMGA